MKFAEDGKIEYESGDWVTVIDSKSTYDTIKAAIGFTFKIQEIMPRALENFNKRDQTVCLDEDNKYFINYLYTNIRPATQQEINRARADECDPDGCIRSGTYEELKEIHRLKKVMKDPTCVDDFREGEWVVVNPNVSEGVPALLRHIDITESKTTGRQITTSGFNFGGNWTEIFMYSNIKNTAKYVARASDKEIAAKLIDEAIKRGYKTGTVLRTDSSYLTKWTMNCDQGFIYDSAEDRLTAMGNTNNPNGDCVVYKKGRWTEIYTPDDFKKTMQLGSHKLEFLREDGRYGSFNYVKVGCEKYYDHDITALLVSLERFNIKSVDILHPSDTEIISVSTFKIKDILKQSDLSITKSN